MSFESDNTASVHPAILDAIREAGASRSASYGADPWTGRLQPLLREIFECDVAIHPTITGTAANALGLSDLTPPWGTVICHSGSHIWLDECGAPGHLGGGLNMAPLDGAHGKLAVATVENWLSERQRRDAGLAAETTLSITQTTECGTVYALDEIGALGDLCQASNLALHMDGARFANALVSIGCTPAEMTWRRGVRMLSLGATKNGAFAAELVIDFRPGSDKSLFYRRMRSGHILSKMRLVSAQLLAYFEGGLWLDLAARANRAATRLATGLGNAGATIVHPVEANEVFVELPKNTAERLLAAGFRFKPRSSRSGRLYRLVTSHDTSAQEIDEFLETIVTAEA